MLLIFFATSKMNENYYFFNEFRSPLTVVLLEMKIFTFDFNSFLNLIK